MTDDTQPEHIYRIATLGAPIADDAVVVAGDIHQWPIDPPTTATYAVYRPQQFLAPGGRKPKSKQPKKPPPKNGFRK